VTRDTTRPRGHPRPRHENHCLPRALQSAIPEASAQAIPSVRRRGLPIMRPTLSLNDDAPGCLEKGYVSCDAQSCAGNFFVNLVLCGRQSPAPFSTEGPVHALNFDISQISPRKPQPAADILEHTAGTARARRRRGLRLIAVAAARPKAPGSMSAPNAHGVVVNAQVRAAEHMSRQPHHISYQVCSQWRP